MFSTLYFLRKFCEDIFSALLNVVNCIGPSRGNILDVINRRQATSWVLRANLMLHFFELTLLEPIFASNAFPVFMAENTYLISTFSVSWLIISVTVILQWLSFLVFYIKADWSNVMILSSSSMTVIYFSNAFSFNLFITACDQRLSFSWSSLSSICHNVLKLTATFRVVDGLFASFIEFISEVLDNSNTDAEHISPTSSYPNKPTSSVICIAFFNIQKPGFNSMDCVALYLKLLDFMYSFMD